MLKAIIKLLKKAIHKKHIKEWLKERERYEKSQEYLFKGNR